MARRLRASSLPQKPLPRVPTKVVIDNESARAHSVVDVFTADRVGLLHTLARTFFDLGLTVDLARISTEGHRAADAFYVRTPTAAARGGARGARRRRADAGALPPPVGTPASGASAALPRLAGKHPGWRALVQPTGRGHHFRGRSG